MFAAAMAHRLRPSVFIPLNCQAQESDEDNRRDTRHRHGRMSGSFRRRMISVPVLLCRDGKASPKLGIYGLVKNVSRAALYCMLCT